MFRLLENAVFYVKQVDWVPPTSRPSVGLFTRFPLKPDQIIFANYPLAVCPAEGRCCWCLWPSEIQCDQCTAAYCSTTCRDLHRPIHSRVCSKNLCVEAQLLVEAASKNRPLTKKSPFRPNWSCFMSLQAQGLPLQAAFEASQVIHFDFQDASRRLATNNFQIQNADLQSIGCGIYPFGALINHSCEANTAATYQITRYQPPIQAFRVLTDIPAYSEITHNYCDLLGTREQRWASLQFQCQCPRCLNPWPVEKHLSLDPQADAQLERILQLPLEEQIQALENFNTRAMFTNRARHVRLVELSVLTADLKRGYRSAVWVYNLDRMCYAYPDHHPALVFQANLLRKLREAGAS